MNSSVTSSTWAIGSLQEASPIGKYFPMLDNVDLSNITPIYQGSWPVGESDRVVRVVTTTAQGTQFFSCQTSQFAAVFNSFIAQKDDDIATLKRIASWQKRRLDYQSVYSAYLLEAIDEEEFIAEAEKFATEYNKVDFAKISSGIQQIQRLLDFEFDYSDYADYFGVEIGDVIEAAGSSHGEARVVGLIQADVKHE